MPGETRRPTRPQVKPPPWRMTMFPNSEEPAMSDETPQQPAPEDQPPTGDGQTLPTDGAPAEAAAEQLAETEQKFLKVSEVARNQNDRLARIREARREVKAALYRVEQTKGEYTEAKADLTAALSRLQEVCDEETADDLFLQVEPVIVAVPVAKLEVQEVAAEETAPAAPMPPKDDERWRSVPVTKLADYGLSARIIDILEDAEIFTIGHVSDWTAKKPLTAIGGIGEAKAKKIDDALIDFWAAWGKGPAQDPPVDPEASAEPTDTTDFDVPNFDDEPEFGDQDKDEAA
jgi:hypothetical protein